MAGRIRPEGIAAVKERTSIEEIVREHVTLRAAGPGSLKGLCPFHDEKTPSFNVRPAAGTYHCFGCGEGGDVIEFVQKVDHLTFAEAVERLAERLGIDLPREEGALPRDTGPRRSRLVEAHRAAREFYEHALLDAPDARPGRDFLRGRGFDSSVARHFGVGYAPRGGEELTRHLRGLGFTDEELVVSGLSARGSRGLYDRFRGRLIWPIADITGDTVGFGARRLFENDPIAAKYLNTAETPVYKKSTVLYGLDLAKKAMATSRQAVVVEGYTDVMAMHLAGVTTAVATCGTAFGTDHITMIRRILRDEADQAPAKVIFTFDGDAAGQAAAMKAFREDQRWASQSFVAVAQDGMDPCELRIAENDQALVDLVEEAVPMFEFAVRTTITRFELDQAEGRVQAMKAAAPIVASIRDQALRPEYIRTVAGWIGIEVDQLRVEVTKAATSGGRGADVPSHTSAGETVDNVPEPSARELASTMPTPDLRDPVVAAERQLLQALLQYPGMVDAGRIDALPTEAFTAPAHRAVFDGLRGAGDPAVTTSTRSWVEAVAAAAPTSVAHLIAELSVADLPAKMDKLTGRPEERYVEALLARVHEVALSGRIADVLSSLRRLSSDPQADPNLVRETSRTLQLLQREQAELRQENAS
ncbi:MAG: DNA primase [Nostocoides sp.]